MKFDLGLFIKMNYNMSLAFSNEMLNLISLFDINPSSIKIEEHRYEGADSSTYKEIVCKFDEGRKELFIQAREGAEGVLTIESVDFMYAGSFYSISDSELEYSIGYYDGEAVEYIQETTNAEPHSFLQFLYSGIKPDISLTINKQKLADKVLKENYPVHEFIYRSFNLNQRKRRKDQDGELPFSI